MTGHVVRYRIFVGCPVVPASPVTEFLRLAKLPSPGSTRQIVPLCNQVFPAMMVTVTMTNPLSALPADAH